MVAKCRNLSCSASFLYLEDGRLFRLESDPALRSSQSRPVEYFWLCQRCASMMTLRLTEDGKVITAPLPESIRDGAALMSVIERTAYCAEGLGLPCQRAPEREDR
jgi:hypothetical protein